MQTWAAHLIERERDRVPCEQDGVRPGPARLPRRSDEAAGLGAEAAGDSEAIHDPTGEER